MDRVVIIAEAGVNHNGELDKAKQLVDAAAAAGADYVKFQTFTADRLVTATAAKADYQQINMPATDESQHAMLKRLELSKEDHLALRAHCAMRGIKFLSSPFDLESIDYLATLDIELFKIPSGELTNYPYLLRLASYGKPIVLSTGMSHPAEIAEAITLLTSHGIPAESITLLHCNTQYPTPMCDVNLLAMSEMKNNFHLPIGYSDHTLGIEVAIAAVALGATLIEKHFTLDRSLPGPDHQASLLPEELAALVRAIRNVESALGTSEKRVTPSEAPNRSVARKSIVAARYISKGEEFTPDNITVMRPGTGLSPMRWPEVVGNIALRSYNPQEMIEL